MKTLSTNNSKKKTHSILFFILFFLFAGQNIAQQVVKGKLVDHLGIALPDIYLQIYSNSLFYSTISSEDGSFMFTGITFGVEDEQLPEGYQVSNSYPNPFHSSTRILITLPIRCQVRMEVYNGFGETATNPVEKYLHAGINHIDVELKDLPDGFYFALITIEGKYKVTKKMMLINSGKNSSVGDICVKHSSCLADNNKVTISAVLDSLVATSSIIGRKTFTDLPDLTEDTLDLGNLTIERYCLEIPTVNYEGRTYNTIKVGDQCWLKENLDVGNVLNKNTPQTNNEIIERYCYDDDPANCLTYGGLYQWDEAIQYDTTSGVQGICPDGWHVPTRAEFDLLVGAAGGSNSLKAIGEGTGNGTGTNTSGFSALLAGSCSQTQHYIYLHEQFQFWTSEEKSSDIAYYLFCYSHNNDTPTGSNLKETAKSVRCIKDSE